jgi:hypothetical protein
MALTAGIATLVGVGRRSATVVATAPSGGTPPYTFQWQVQWIRGGLPFANATGTGVTTLSATITNLGPAAKFNVQLLVTDAASDTSVSNTVTATTLPLPWFPGLAKKRPRPESITDTRR